MAHFQGMERTAAVWEELRAELAAFTLSISGVREWQEAFVACQEFQPESEDVSPLYFCSKSEGSFCDGGRRRIRSRRNQRGGERRRGRNSVFAFNSQCFS